MNNENITLTDRAAEHVKGFLMKQKNGLGLRVSVKHTGCSGHQYLVETAESINEHDLSFEIKGVKIIVDEKYMKYLAGTELDFVQKGLKSGFRFNNPNTTNTCGCGESFTVDDKHTGETH